MYLGLAAMLSAGVAYHYYTINDLQKDVSFLTENNATLNQQVTSMGEAAIINEKTIIDLNENISRQITTISRLTTTNTQIEREKEEYLSIFKRHNLSDLARRRPGLIENRINDGTAEVFENLMNSTTGANQ